MYLLRHQLIKMAVHLFFCVASTIIEYKAKKNLAELKAANLPFGLEKEIKVKIKNKKQLANLLSMVWLIRYSDATDIGGESTFYGV